MEDMDTPERSGPGGQGLIFNLMTVLVLLATLLSAGVYGILFINPNAGFNPFPPPTLPSVAQFPTATNTSEFPTLPATWTLTPPFTPSDTATASNTPEDTGTPTPSGTPGPTLTPSKTPSKTPGPTATGPTPTPSRTISSLPFTLQGEAPVPLPNFANNAQCNWMGIAGQAFDLSGKPMSGLVVHLEGGGLVLDALTGSAPAYGPGGYEFFLNNRPVATTGIYRLQLLNTSGSPLSDVIKVDTFADCNKNLVLVNFIQNH